MPTMMSIWASYFTNYKFSAFHVALYTHFNGRGNKGGKCASLHVLTFLKTIQFSIMMRFLLFGPERDILYSPTIHPLLLSCEAKESQWMIIGPVCVSVSFINSQPFGGV